MHAIVLDSSGDNLYCADYSGSSIKQVRVGVVGGLGRLEQTLVAVTGGPLGVALSEDDQTLYVAIHGAPCKIYTVNLASPSPAITDFVGQSSCGAPSDGVYDGVGAAAHFSYIRQIL